MVHGETPGSVTTGTVGSEYSQGSNAGEYTITASNFSAANYSLSYATAVLTVNPLEGSAANGVSISLSDAEFAYTGSPIQPPVTVTRNGAEISTADYDISYADNTVAGTAGVTVSFKRNYSGSLSKSFTIVPADFNAQVVLEGWTYGDAPAAPSLDDCPSDGTVSYYYRAADTAADTAVTEQPVNAGSYLVYAVVEATQNFNRTVTGDTSFTIATKSIIFTAASNSWVYDGSAHSDTEYTQQGAFVGTDSLHSISVAGSITDVGSAQNIVSYVLTTATNASNYAITTVNGTLTVTARQLSVPTNHHWDTVNPGSVTWVAISRNNLEVEYELSLYRVSADGSTRTLVDTLTATGTSCDLADLIAADCAEQGAASAYCYTIKSIPSAGDAKYNYSESDASDYSSSINTAKLTVAGDSGIAITALAGQQSRYLIAGDTTSLTAITVNGYTFTSWGSDSQSVSIADSTNKSTSITLSASITSPIASITITGSTTDDAPIIDAFTAENSADLQSVVLTLHASDIVGITSWAVTQSSTAPAQNDSAWTSVGAVGLGALERTYSATSAGTYYAWVRDSGGNVVCCSAPITVYSIAFSAGEGGSGSMTAVLKAQNTYITLPDSTFTRDGKAFVDWVGSTGRYAAGGAYAANASDTLTVEWTDIEYSYTVRYFYMNTDGTYSAEADDSAIFSALYGTTVDCSNAAIQKTHTGMSADADRFSSITLTQSGQTLNLYYKRNTYTITFTYREPDAAEDTVFERSFLYGAAVTEVAKPTVEGYSFIGWVYGSSGTMPDTMPACSLSATGTFYAVDTTYAVNYYTMGLDGEYALAFTESKNAYHSEILSFGTDTATALTGFTAAGVSISYGEAGGTQPGTLASSVQGSASAADGAKLYVNYYYARNSYTLTLKVWQGTRDTNDSLKYDYSWTVPYGTVLTASYYESYNSDNWPHSETYTIASYSDWSTGTAPETMPAGDVVVSRDFVLATESSFNVQIYYEDAAQGEYTLQTTLMYYAEAGETVTLGNGSTYTVDYSTFSSYIPYFSYYVFSENNQNNVLSATVTDVDSGEDAAVLRIYFDRRTVTSTIRYYYNSGSGYALITSVQKSGRWGESYNIDPLAYFDGQSPAAESYLDAGYIVSYSGRYFLYNWSWPTAKLTDEDDLNGSYTSIFGQDNSSGSNQNYVNVYYTLPVAETQYYISVNYRPSGLSALRGAADQPVTVTVDGTEYYVRVAGRAFIFNSSFTAATGYENYPGAAVLNGTWTYSGEPNDGFTEVTIGNGTYYINGSYLYVIDTSNQLFKGNRVSYTYAAAAPGSDSVTAFLENYKTDDAYDSDTARAGAYVYSRYYSGIMYDNASLYITFAYHDVYTITYNMGGNAAQGTQSYAYGTQVSGVDYSNTAFAEKYGYTIKWYTDYAFTTPVEFPFGITSDRTFYGRYEKNTVNGVDCVYYQLANPVTINGQAVYYITENDLQATELDGHLTSDTADGVTNYYYDGTLVLIEIAHPTLTFTTVSLDAANYALSSYHYDDTSPDNALVSYCETSAVRLRAYFARDMFVLTVDPDNSIVSNTETYENAFGTTMTLAAPTYDGYTFDGWSWEKWDDTANDGEGGYVTWSGGPTGSGEVSFGMPAFTVRATAQWSAASYEQTVPHYFCNIDGGYETAALELLQQTQGEADTIEFNGSSYSGTLYYSDGDIIGASVTISEKTLWFLCSSRGAKLSQLIAVTQTDTFTSEQLTDVADYGTASTYHCEPVR